MAKEDDFQNTQIVDMSDSLDADQVSAMLDRMVAGKYRILRRLARGGMGVVYVAEHESLGRKVVIKVLSYHLADDSRAQSRFEREAKGLSVLDHPNVVTVHDFGLERGLTYIVMEFVDGENLSQRVRRKGRLPYDELLPIAIQTIDAIGAAHEKGIVHRDVKPSNVMVTSRAGRSDYVKVLDFGLAKLATSTVDITAGNLVGTVSYLAPEVIRGGDALPTADVYSLGVMLYYLLSGTKPFQAQDDMSVLYQHVNVEPDWVGDLIPPGEAPQEFLEFIHTCMSKDPSTRPKDAGVLRELLGGLVSLPSISAFSIDSAAALPRYRPTGERSRLDNVQPPGDSGLTIDNAPFDVSRQSMTRPSIAMARPKPVARIFVIAFTFFSLGLVAVALILRPGEPEPAQPAPVSAKTTPDPVAVEQPAAPAATAARFTLTTTPSGDVAIDGKLKGRTPMSMDVVPGKHVVSVSEPGFNPWTQTIELLAGRTHDLDVFLEKQEEKKAPPDVIRRPQPRPVTKPQATPTRAAQPDPVPAKQPEPAAKQPVAEKPEPEVKTFGTKPKKGGLLQVNDAKKGLLPVGE